VLEAVHGAVPGSIPGTAQFIIRRNNMSILELIYNDTIKKLEMAKNQLDHLSNEVDDYHVQSQFATASGKVEDTIKFIKDIEE
jgi:hypothetical protein